MEQWHFLSMQIWINDIGNFLVALFQFLVFVAAIFSMDYVKNSPEFVVSFGFECKLDNNQEWYVKRSAKSSTLWEMHILIVFMYSFVVVVVLSVIPYKYNRLKKTESEIKADAEREAKREERRRKRRRKREKRRKKGMVQISPAAFENPVQNRKTSNPQPALKKMQTFAPSS